jgi:hypothetical protein
MLYDRAMKAIALALAAGVIFLAACGEEQDAAGTGQHGEGTQRARAEPAAPPPEPAAADSGPANFGVRCMAVAARTDTDPEVLAADRRTCDCMLTTLRQRDMAMLLDFTELDAGAPDAQERKSALYKKYRMTEPQFMTEIRRIQGLGRTCLKRP